MLTIYILYFSNRFLYKLFYKLLLPFTHKLLTATLTLFRRFVGHKTPCKQNLVDIDIC